MLWLDNSLNRKGRLKLGKIVVPTFIFIQIYKTHGATIGQD